MKNRSKGQCRRELIQLLGLEKSLVYFSTSLKADDVTLEKILRGRVIKLYEEDQDLLEDVLIELNRLSKWLISIPEFCQVWFRLLLLLLLIT